MAAPRSRCREIGSDPFNTHDDLPTSPFSTPPLKDVYLVTMVVANIFRGVRTLGMRDLVSRKTLFGWPPADPTRETAWLDGLRGVAAFLVMIYHYHLQLWNPMMFEAPYGAYNLKEGREPFGDGFWEFWRLPLFRLWMDSGHTQVSIFFVLSGFVLSWGPLASIRSGQDAKLAQSLGSATFRRWIRLYFPCFAVSLWEALEVHFGLREMPGKSSMNIFAQIWDWVKSCESFANPFLVNRDSRNSLHAYDWTMWTIPYEFAGSLLVFTTLLAVGRVRNFGKRSLVMLAIVIWALYRAEWNFLLFSTGMLLSNYVRQRGGFKKISESMTTRGTAIWSLVLAISMYLGGLPEPSEAFTRPGYEWTRAFTPFEWSFVEGGGRLWWCLAGILFVTSSCHLAGVRRFFELSFVRYLGRISYMLYLTHRIVLNLLGNPYIRLILGIFQRVTFIDDTSAGDGPLHPLGTLLCYILIMGVMVPSALIVAHWSEVLIDAPSTRFARTVDDWFTKGPGPASGNSDSSILPVHAGSSTRREESIGLLATTSEGIEIESRVDGSREITQEKNEA